MAAEHTATCNIVIGGLDCEVCVVFEVESYGSPDGYFEPGEPPSIMINDVRMNDEDGRSIYDLCEQTRDLWAKPRYVEGYFLFRHGPGVPKAGWRSYELDGYRSYPAYCQIGFNSPYGAFHSLLDTLYEKVIDNHMPEYEPQDDDWR